MRLVAARAFGDSHERGIQRLVREMLGIALGRGEDIGHLVRDKVRRISRRDIREGFHRSRDATAKVASLRGSIDRNGNFVEAQASVRTCGT